MGSVANSVGMGCYGKGSLGHQHSVPRSDAMLHVVKHW